MSTNQTTIYESDDGSMRYTETPSVAVNPNATSVNLTSTAMYWHAGRWVAYAPNETIKVKSER